MTPMQIDFGGDQTFAISSLSDDFSARVHDHALADVGKLRVFSGAIHAGDIGLIFNSARLQQRDPMLNASDRPTGNDGDQIGSAPDRSAKDFRKTQVVTNERRQ